VRKISGDICFRSPALPENGINVCDDDGTVLDLIDTGGKLEEKSGLEYYSGILAPGFVNAHCHLELSHLRGKIPEKTGSGGFLGAISQLRNKQPENAETAIPKADRMMWAAGISAVGDVSNTTASLATKLKSKIFYHTFVETFGFHPPPRRKSF
jgi:cytosine/adenosine deaminase-related metal-dependent hydrolase